MFFKQGLLFLDSRLVIVLLFSGFTATALAQSSNTARFTGLKADMASSIESKAKLTQESVDTLFSFSELGFQEFETQRYLTDLLAGNGFDIELGVANIPSSWWASSWDSIAQNISAGTETVDFHCR